MNIYLLKQRIENGYDTYDSCVVVAENEDAARRTHPSEYVTHYKNGKFMGTYQKGGEYENDSPGWVLFSQIDQIEVSLIGVAADGIKPGVVCASFNAG